MTEAAVSMILPARYLVYNYGVMMLPAGQDTIEHIIESLVWIEEPVMR